MFGNVELARETVGITAVLRTWVSTTVEYSKESANTGVVSDTAAVCGGRKVDVQKSAGAPPPRRLA